MLVWCSWLLVWCTWLLVWWSWLLVWCTWLLKFLVAFDLAGLLPLVALVFAGLLVCLLVFCFCLLFSCS